MMIKYGLQPHGDKNIGCVVSGPQGLRTGAESTSTYILGNETYLLVAIFVAYLQHKQSFLDNSTLLEAYSLMLL